MQQFIYEFSRWAVPLFITFIIVFAQLRGVKVYETFIQGAAEGFKLAVRLIPYLVAMMLAVGIFRQAGVNDLIAQWGKGLFKFLGIPPEVLPLALMRPLSGGGALGITAELINKFGPDSFIGRLASTMQGSSDTTFFVLSVYFGSVGIRKYRYALGVGLFADIVTFLTSVYIVNLVFY
ncbi:MAG: spore maturation protein [Peptococcia bacterium]